MANVSSFAWGLEEDASPWDSTGHVTLAVVLVFVLSPLMIFSNALLLTSIYRYKRLRNPSNYFLLSLCSADLAVGLLLPAGLYFEFTRHQIDCVLLCLFPYCVLILICSVSILSVTAVALDRYTSLASPLRYNNLVTHRSVGRYTAIFWIYSLILASSPILYWYYERAQSYLLDQSCSFGAVLDRVRLFLFFSLFAPCCAIILTSYAYVYVIARYHARAIFSVEITFRRPDDTVNIESRYGRTLAATVGTFLLLWLPFQVCMLCDVFAGWTLLSGRRTFYLGVLALANSAVDPWVYGYRNSEFRYAILRILEDLVPKLRNTLRRHHPQRFSNATSCASNVRLCASPNHVILTEGLRVHTCLHPNDFLEVPTAHSSVRSPSSGSAVVDL